MTPEALSVQLADLVAHHVRHAVMIWGPPGVGKSSIVAGVAKAAGIAMIDVRLSQLAPTDLRGLPVPADGVSRWFPPEFLPRGGEGILFLDELNMAAPTMQGVAQQLILDRRVGSYTLPDGWFVWAAGNRKEDRASVFDMPAPLANRFVHLEVEADLESFLAWAALPATHAANASEALPRIDARIAAFLAFRPQLLHHLDAKRPAWPSPRSWEMASTLLNAGMGIAPAVGDAAASEFEGFCTVYQHLPALDEILEGKASNLDWPDEPSARYALVLGLANRASTSASAMHAFRWLAERSAPEWIQLYAADVARRLRAVGAFGVLASVSEQEPAFRRFSADYASLTGYGAPVSSRSGASSDVSSSEQHEVEPMPTATGALSPADIGGH